MAADFPSAIANINRPTAGTKRNAPGYEGHALHAKLADEIEAIEAVIGVTGSTVPTSIEYRLADVQAVAAGAAADVVTAQATADDAVADTRLLAWGLRTDPITGFPVIPSVAAHSKQCLFWAWPGSSGTARNGEHHLYVPVGPYNDYYGCIIGVRGKSAYSVPFDCVHGIFRPGLHTQASACTRVGSWGTSANAAALWGSYYYSVAAGATISATVAGETLAAHLFLSSNGGYAVVSVDGSYEFNSPLPVFTADDLTAGLCRAQDVGRRYLCSYLTNAWSYTQVVAEGLAAGNHSLTLEVTGTKPAASTDYRFYVESLVGCAASNACTQANTYMVPIRRFCELLSTGGTAYYCAPMFAPAGSTDYQFISTVHADNTNSKEVSVVGPTVLVDGVDRSSPTLGTFYTGENVQWYQESTASHKANLATQVVNRKRRYSAMANRTLPIMIDVTLTWLVDGMVKVNYPMMLPVNAYNFPNRSMPVEVANRMWFGAEMLETAGFSADDNSTTDLGVQEHVAQRTAPQMVVQFDDCMTWASLVASNPEPGMSAATTGRYLLQDRADKLDKLYVSDVYYGYAPVVANQVQRYLMGWGGLMAADYPA